MPHHLLHIFLAPLTPESLLAAPIVCRGLTNNKYFLTLCDSAVKGRSRGLRVRAPNSERGEGPIARNIATARHPKLAGRIAPKTK